MNKIKQYRGLIDKLTEQFRLCPDEISELCVWALLRIYSPKEADQRELLLLETSRKEFRESIFEFRRLIDGEGSIK